MLWQETKALLHRNCKSAWLNQSKCSDQTQFRVPWPTLQCSFQNDHGVLRFQPGLWPIISWYDILHSQHRSHILTNFRSYRCIQRIHCQYHNPPKRILRCPDCHAPDQWSKSTKWWDCSFQSRQVRICMELDFSFVCDIHMCCEYDCAGLAITTLTSVQFLCFPAGVPVTSSSMSKFVLWPVHPILYAYLPLDYVTVVFGIFGLFVALTWAWTRKRYHGPVSSAANFSNQLLIFEGYHDSDWPQYGGIPCRAICEGQAWP